MSATRHVMILASAGSGKTYALTNRFVSLLAQGAAPERIVALTFTRKAAGEFFDEILNKLADAAADEVKAGRLAADIGRPDLGAADFGRLLRGVVDAMHRLRLGTLDSFFARVARAFPFELGLAGEFEILQEHAARTERQRVLQRLFTHTGELQPEQREFIEAFKRATMGMEEKQLGARLDKFIDEHHEKYLGAPAAEVWGNAATIWPEGQPWLRTVELAPALAALRTWLATAEIAPKQRQRWENFLQAAEMWAPGVDIKGPLAYVLEKALEAWAELGRGDVELAFDHKKQCLTSAAGAALADVVCHVAGGELTRKLATTRGIHAVVRGYDQAYHAAVRRAGKLTFADVQRLLMPGGGERPRLTRVAEEEEGNRLFIDYRLDAEIDHWLLDEFQDTSYGQWSILRNLIDEAVQDAEGRRSFFCVGDVKQAIFTWREGDPRLFGEIFRYYNDAAPGSIEQEYLVRSWRSGPALIEMVNAVFGAGEVIAEFFPGRPSELWNEAWRDHESAVPDRVGQAALLHADDGVDRFATTLRLVQELDPLAAGLTCAVLVRKNDEAAAIADYLRREGGVPAVAESDLHVATDNPMGAAMLALFQAAAHPGDTLAGEHLRMSPLGEITEARELGTPEALSRRVLSQVHAEGFERTAAYWLRADGNRMQGSDVFGAQRARQFIAAAALFDATGSRDVTEFVAFMQVYKEREPESAAMVRVLTIHKSKGLGFDVVIVPALEGTRVDQAREGLAMKKAADRSVEWVLDLPTKALATADAVLTDYVREAEAVAGYEALSLLYVAMTRAKRAMYVITERVGKSSSRNFPQLLARTLGEADTMIKVGGLTLPGAWAFGDPDWRQQVSTLGPPAAPDETLPLLPEADRTVGVRAVALRPSSERTGVVPAPQVFALNGSAASEFGTSVHGLLADIEWWPHASGEAWKRGWEARGVEHAAIAEAWRCVTAAALGEVWRRPAGKAEVWREKAFEILLDGAWITGVFDRVVVARDDAGRATAAVVYDFKTDRVGNEGEIARAVERHAGQLDIYRRAAAVLTGLPVAAVVTELVFTAAARRVVVPGAAR
ncbi:UvrD-helicase domain-containing protein [Horticoccus luteus]|uniref:DNA 3'-5' helicase n=1 Tax=Horticoccus luteus TaxID=2862869 RepID=A0A8F9TUX1_9BACT|nr:UvrD-helicase domain-containing protein [Horticoccus luteus]QYM79561.1 UvrD-helicase domain-containing protein [Horticoccus luteus]